MTSFMDHEGAETNSSLTEREHSAPLKQVHADTEAPLEHGGGGTNASLRGFEQDMAQAEPVHADTDRSLESEGVGTNDAFTEGGKDEADYLRSLGAEVVNQEDLERSIARQV